MPALSFSMSGDKELINSPYKSHLTRIKSSNTRYRTALNSVVRWKDINRTSRISCKTIGTSSVITLLPNLSCCPSLPVKRKNPSTLRYPRHPSKLQNGSCCTTDYLWMLKMVVFSIVSSLVALKMNLICLSTSWSIHLQINLQRK